MKIDCNSGFCCLFFPLFHGHSCSKLVLVDLLRIITGNQKMVCNWIGIAAVTINLCRKKGWGNTKAEPIIEFGYSKGKIQEQFSESMAGQLVNGVGMSEIDGPSKLERGLWKLNRWILDNCSEVTNTVTFSRSTVLSIQVQWTVN